MKSKLFIAATAVIIIGLVLTGLVLRDTGSGARSKSSDHDAHGAHEEDGGEKKHLSQEGFEIEIGLSEGEGPPHLEASIYMNEEPLDPHAVQLNVYLIRPNKAPEALSFSAQNSHLKSVQPVPEPHVFKIQVSAQYQDKNYRWEYWQIEGGVKLDSAARRESGIEIKTAGPAQIATVLTLPGQIQLDPRRVAHVVPRVEGVVTEVHKYLGDTVKAGEVLTVLESRDLADLKSQYLVAVRRLDLARANFERERQLWKEKISAKVDYLVAKKDWAESKALTEAAAQKLIALHLSQADLKSIASGQDTSFNRYKLHAPFAGEVVKKHLALGEAVKADTKIYTIADLSVVWGAITVYSKDMSAVLKGQTVTVKAEDPGYTADGTVFYVEPLIGEQTRSTKAYIEIPNPNGLWRPGLFVTAKVLQNRTNVRVAVTTDALQTYQDKPVVFVLHEDIFEPRPVVLGKRGDHWVEIRQGLSESERYASGNSFVLKSELGKSSAAHSH